MHYTKTTVTIPAWFELHNYTATKHLTPQQWSDQLLLRHRVDRALAFNGNTPIFPKDTLEAMIPKGCAPHLQPPETISKTLAAQSEFFRAADGESPNMGPVIPTWWAELMATLELNGQQPSSEDEYRALDELLQDQSLRLTIDLCATDTVILKQIKQMLPRWRMLKETQSPDQAASEAALAKLHQYRVLQYIDLLHWSKINHTRIPSPQLARVLFPEPRLEESRHQRFIDETLKPRANLALSAGFIASISR